MRGARRLYETAAFRSRVDMGRHRFGEGEYQYFADPLPPLVRACASISIRGWRASRTPGRSRSATPSAFRRSLADLRERCRAAGQTRPTPLLLRYGAGGYNACTRTCTATSRFPCSRRFRSAVPADYTGGDFLLVEHRPRAQSVGEALSPGQGDLVLATTPVRPARGVAYTACRCATA